MQLLGASRFFQLCSTKKVRCWPIKRRKFYIWLKPWRGWGQESSKGRTYCPPPLCPAPGFDTMHFVIRKLKIYVEHTGNNSIIAYCLIFCRELHLRIWISIPLPWPPTWRRRSSRRRPPPRLRSRRPSSGTRTRTSSRQRSNQEMFRFPAFFKDYFVDFFLWILRILWWWFYQV